MTPQESKIENRMARQKEILIPDFLQKSNVASIGSSVGAITREVQELSKQESFNIEQAKAIQAQVPHTQKQIEEEKHMEVLKNEITLMTVEQQQEIAKCLRYGVMFRELQSTMLKLAEYADATREASKKLDDVFVE